MTKLSFTAFIASAVCLLAAPAHRHSGHAGEIHDATCPKFGCLGFLSDSFELPPIGYKKVYTCSNGHKFAVK
jgi:hypothetical protein